ncbi:hypothetical protein ABTK33_20880, partial [Acinetobacter baumannii]
DQRRTPLPDMTLEPGDILVVEGDPAMIDTLVAETPLIAASDTRRVVRDEPSEEIRAIEAVVQPGSVLIGRSARRLDMQQR